jgi:hypothetical protein
MNYYSSHVGICRHRWSSGYTACLSTHWLKLGPARWILRMIEVRSTTSFEEEVKPSASCLKILRHVKDPYSMREIFVGKINGYLWHSFSFSVTRCLCWLLPGAQVGKSGIGRTQMGKHNGSVMVAVYGTPCSIPPHKQ